MTQKNKNIIMICVAVFIGSYIFRGLFISTMRMFYRRPPIVRQKALPKPSPTAPPSGAADAPPPIPNLSGVWIGTGHVKDKGFCHLRAELKQNDPQIYTAYTMLACADVTAFGKVKDPAAAQELLADNTNPQPAIMTGKPENGALHFTAQQAIGTDSQGCSISDLTMTPFGTAGIAAKWFEGTCPGGNMVMRRQP